MSASVIQCTNHQEEAGTIMKPSIDTVIVEQLAQAQISDPAYHAMLKALVAKVAL